jgi:SAM-dependent methyltransferase
MDDGWMQENQRCPRCRSRLLAEEKQSAYRCENLACALSATATFPVVGSHPVLIDFERSIFDRDTFLANAGSSVVPRHAPIWKALLRRILWGENPVAERNATRLLALLLERQPRPVLLVIGGGNVGSRAAELYSHAAIRLIAFDVYCSPVTNFVADAHAIPLADESVDAVWIQAVLEHVLMPDRVVSEIYRTLKADGVVYADTPFLQHVHEGPYDFTRFTESGHRWLFRDFSLLDSGVVAGPGTVLLWSLRYAVASVLRNHRLANIVCLPFFWLRFLDRIAAPRFAIDAASGVYFLGRKSKTAIDPKDMITHYRGANRTQF